MAIPETYDLVLPLLEIIKDKDEYKVQEITEEVEEVKEAEPAEENTDADKYDKDGAKTENESRFPYKVRIFNEVLSMSGDFDGGKIKIPVFLDQSLAVSVHHIRFA